MSDDEIIALYNGKKYTGEILEAIKLLREIGEERFLEEWVQVNHYLGRDI